MLFASSSILFSRSPGYGSVHNYVQLSNPMTHPHNISLGNELLLLAFRVSSEGSTMEVSRAHACKQTGACGRIGRVDYIRWRVDINQNGALIVHIETIHLGDSGTVP